MKDNIIGIEKNIIFLASYLGVFMSESDMIMSIIYF